MLKPTSIRAMRFILYFKLAMFVVVMVASFANTKSYDDFTGGKVATIAFNIAVSVLSMVSMLLLINKRKLFPSLIMSFIVLWFSIDTIQFVLAIVLVLLFFLRQTREYFRGDSLIEPRQDERSNDAEDAIDGDKQASSTEDPLEKPAKPQVKLKKDPEVYIREATPEDTDTIHSLMLIAFEEYRTAIPPSSALEETDESVSKALREGSESAAILYEDDTAAAMVRFKYIGDAIYFFRLSVVPNRRRRGYARQLVKWIEKQGISKGLNISRCKVRQSVQNNLVLYQDMGYEIVDTELVVRPQGTVKALTMEKKLGV
ncbi:GNAT family N-acetyltransferase [Cohnella luojiensis]|nr:GNAT family N-acetyltransferase [Cohnella luojiensis]